ncbi:MAG: hypothetical protein NUV91_00845 [Candidatus Omnitrophica bacterium]|nr:hypothetical protein [Candidatus Omnitrophota bacterium]
MKYPKTLFLTAILPTLLLAFFSLGLPLKAVLADKEGDKAEYQRKINKQIQDLQMRIDETREDYREDGVHVEQQIKGYENRIAEIKREANAEMDEKNRKAADVEKERKDVGSRLGKIHKDFNEWRLKRAINSYDDKIEELKNKAEDETTADRKRELEERIQKLDAKYNAAKAKLNDLRMTDGENWDRIEQELDASLKEIDRDYEEAAENR